MLAKDYRRLAREKLGGSLFEGNWILMVGICLVYSLICSALSYTGIGLLILGGVFELGLIFCSLNIVRGEKLEFAQMFKGFESEFLSRSLICGLLKAVFLFLWFLLFIIPGIIKTYSYAMSIYIVRDNPEISGLDAITKSREMMYGHKWKLFCLHFSFIGWILLSILLLGIPMLWVSPYMQVAEAEFYENLKNGGQTTEGITGVYAPVENTEETSETSEQEESQN